MQETPVFVVIEVVSVEDPAGLKTYVQRASELIGPLGGVMLGGGGTSVDGEPGFAPLAIQRWPSEAAFRAWLDSDAYQPLREIRLASATMRVAIGPISAGAMTERGSPHEAR
jgi:uncharacterized protein (DUF1330 family)